MSGYYPVFNCDCILFINQIQSILSTGLKHKLAQKKAQICKFLMTSFMNRCSHIKSCFAELQKMQGHLHNRQKEETGYIILYSSGHKMRLWSHVRLLNFLAAALPPHFSSGSEYYLTTSYARDGGGLSLKQLTTLLIIFQAIKW